MQIAIEIATNGAGAGVVISANARGMSRFIPATPGSGSATPAEVADATSAGSRTASASPTTPAGRAVAAMARAVTDFSGMNSAVRGQAPTAIDARAWAGLGIAAAVARAKASPERREGKPIDTAGATGAVATAPGMNSRVAGGASRD